MGSNREDVLNVILLSYSLLLNSLLPLSLLNNLITIREQTIQTVKLNYIISHMEHSTDEKYTKFKDWLQSNGCRIAPGVTIPTLFPDGGIGVQTVETLRSHQLILAIPSKLILTAEKVYKLPSLKRLFANNDDLFDYEACDENEFNILAVFLMHQQSKILKARHDPLQQKESPASFWEPYFSAASQCSTILDWPQESYSDLLHQIKEEIVFFQIQMVRLKMTMIEYLSKRKEFEGVSEKNLGELFDWAYKFVMTRCFGECFRTTCLIPGVDMFNHGNHIVDHQLINLRKQAQSEEDKKYKKYSGVIDLSLIDGPSKTNIYSAHYSYLQEATNHPLQDLLYLNLEQTYNKITEVNKKMFQGDKGTEVFDMEFYSDDDREDNDTEEDEGEEREIEMTFLKQQQKQQVEEFIKEYKKFKVVSYQQAKDINEKNVKEGAGKSQEEEIIQEKPEPTEAKSEFIMEVTQTQPTPVNNQSTQPTPEPQGEKQMSESSNDSPSSSSSSSSYSQTPAWHNQQNTYFSLYSQYSIHPNTQLLISYGSRTNKFLLIWYGFCYRNNYYDSVSFRLNATFQNELDVQKLLFEHYYLSIWKQKKEVDPYPNISKQFRLKRTRINSELIMFLRVFLMHQYKGEDQSKLMGTIPSSVEFELFLFEYMMKLLNALKKRYPIGMIEEWRVKEEKFKDFHSKFKRIFYEQQLAIINEHISMATSVIQILKEIRESEEVELNSIYRKVEFRVLRKIRAYIQQLSDNMEYIQFNPYQDMGESTADVNNL